MMTAMLRGSCLLATLMVALIGASADDHSCMDGVYWAPVRSDHNIKTLADEHGVAPGYILSRNPEIETPEHWSALLASGNATIRLPCEDQGEHYRESRILYTMSSSAPTNLPTWQ